MLTTTAINSKAVPLAVTGVSLFDVARCCIRGQLILVYEEHMEVDGKIEGRDGHGGGGVEGS